MSAFVDTSGFLAVLNINDARHEDARGIWAGLVEAGGPIHTTNYVVVETISLLHHRFGLSAVRRFQEDVLPVVRVTWVDEAAHAAAVGALIAGGRQGPSLVDCVSFDVIGRLRIRSVLAFDRHFSERGFHP